MLKRVWKVPFYEILKIATFRTQKIKKPKLFSILIGDDLKSPLYLLLLKGLISGFFLFIWLVC